MYKYEIDTYSYNIIIPLTYRIYFMLLLYYGIPYYIIILMN